MVFFRKRRAREAMQYQNRLREAQPEAWNAGKELAGLDFEELEGGASGAHLPESRREISDWIEKRMPEVASRFDELVKLENGSAPSPREEATEAFVIAWSDRMTWKFLARRLANETLRDL